MSSQGASRRRAPGASRRGRGSGRGGAGSSRVGPGPGRGLGLGKTIDQLFTDANTAGDRDIARGRGQETKIRGSKGTVGISLYRCCILSLSQII